MFLKHISWVRQPIVLHIFSSSSTPYTCTSKTNQLNTGNKSHQHYFSHNKKKINKQRIAL